MASAIKRFIPLFDRILVERFAPELKTKGGVLLPEKSQGKVLEATVLAVGPGARNDKGDHIPPSVKVGEKVLLPEYGGTKINFEDKPELVPVFMSRFVTGDQKHIGGKLDSFRGHCSDYYIFRDADILGKFES